MNNIHDVILISRSAISGAPYTVNNIKDTTTSRLPADSPWSPFEAGETAFRHFNGVTATGGTPFMSASGFRSKLRDIAFFDIALKKAFPDGNPKLTWDSLFANEKGGKMVGPVTPETLNAIRDSNPIMGLFGGAFPYFIQGRIVPGHFYAQFDRNPLEAWSGVRHDPLGRGAAEKYGIISNVEEMILDQDTSKAENAKKKNAKAAHNAALNDLKAKKTSGEIGNAEFRKQKAIIEATKTDGEINKTMAVENQQLIERFWAIPANTSFSQTTRAIGAREHEIGLLLLSMGVFRHKPSMGARSGSGYGGDLDIDWDIEILGKGPCGTVSNPSGFALDCISTFEQGVFDYEIRSK